MTLEQLLIEHSAPTLAGLKSASLICLAHLDETGESDLGKLVKKGVSFKVLQNRKGRRLLLVYREKQMMDALRSPGAKRLLEERGYSLSSADEAISHLRKRFLEESFPHEVGLFLGYPVNDVKGFIENNGENFIASGLWKVYDDAERAKDIFAKYRKCSMVYRSCYANGTGIERLCVTA